MTFNVNENREIFILKSHLNKKLIVAEGKILISIVDKIAA